MNRSALYEIKKRALVCEFKKNLEEKATFSLNKKTSNLFRDRKAGQSKKLDVKQFNQVISIDPVGLIAEVEGMITFDDLSKETLKHNCLPPVIPELKTITVGGALVGLGIESSSFRYGLVHETILEIEVLTGDGSVVVCRPDNEHADLFYAFPNSFGTFGYALKVKMKLIPASKFVRLTNLHMGDIDVYFQKLNELCLSRGAAYIDGVIFDKNEMVIVLGEFADEVPYLSDYTYMDVYYQSIRKRDVNYLTTYDYIWRWDADWFWCSKHFGMQFRVLRLLFGKLILRSAAYWKISKFASKFRFKKRAHESVIQDILIPIERGPEFYHFFEELIGIKPIWTCPYYSNQSAYTLVNLKPKKLYIDFGFWDFVPSDKPEGFYNRLIERKTEELNGFKSLYSNSYYSEEEFWKIYPKNTVEKLKAKYDPQGVFKGLYEKCVLSK